jgi:hypothetical protein
MLIECIYDILISICMLIDWIYMIWMHCSFWLKYKWHVYWLNIYGCRNRCERKIPCGSMGRTWDSSASIVWNMARGGATRLNEHLVGKSRNIVCCTKFPSDIQNYFLCELQRVQERKNSWCMSGLSRSFITLCSISGKTQPHEPTSHGESTRPTFFEPKILWLRPQRSIM